MTAPFARDSRWVKKSFLVASDDLEDLDVKNRTLSTASFKFTDTTPGGNFAINPPPQFTASADPKVKGRFAASKGMGRYYSEAIDDNSQLIHMRFGVPQFNSLTTFFTGFYDSDAGRLARTGRAQSTFYTLGKVAGMVVSIISWPLFFVQIAGSALRFALTKPSSKFYYLKPTMPLYWNAVTTMVNHIATNKGIVPRVMTASVEEKFGLNGVNHEESLKKLHTLLPGIFKESGGIDVYAMATRAQRLARKNMLDTEAALNIENGSVTAAISGLLNKVYTGADLNNESRTLENYLSRWWNSKPSDTSVSSVNADKEKSDLSSTTEARPEAGLDDGFWEFLRSELDDGAAFVTFRVNSTGSVSESFSNSVGESEIASSINNMSSQSRNTNFNFANGNIAGIFNGAVNAAKDFVSGMANQFHIQGIAALGGAAFVDIPKHWQSSTASLPRSTYTINLVSPYGNPISRLLNIDIPLCMLLAGALPLSTGKQSYTSPFLVEIYDRGRCQTRLGIIDSLSITRGTGNLGFTNEGQPLGVEVSFSVLDLSSIMHMPISENFSFGEAATTVIAGGVGAAAGAVVGSVVGAKTAVVGAAMGAAGGAALASGAFDEDTVYSDYLSVLSGMSLADQVYTWRKLKINLTRKLGQWDNFFSVSHFAQWVGDVPPVRLMSAFYRGTQR